METQSPPPTNSTVSTDLTKEQLSVRLVTGPLEPDKLFPTLTSSLSVLVLTPTVAKVRSRFHPRKKTPFFLPVLTIFFPVLTIFFFQLSICVQSMDRRELQPSPLKAVRTVSTLEPSSVLLATTLKAMVKPPLIPTLT